MTRSLCNGAKEKSPSEFVKSVCPSVSVNPDLKGRRQLFSAFHLLCVVIHWEVFKGEQIAAWSQAAWGGDFVPPSSGCVTWGGY